MTRQSLDALRRTLIVEQPKQLDIDGRKFLADFARADIAKVVAEAGARGARPAVTAYANTPGNRNLDSVKLPGPIVAIFDYRSEVVRATLDALRAASPVDSGLYRNSHRVLVNGTEVGGVPTTLGAGDEVTIVNPVAYARRLEIGKTKSGRDFVVSVPNRIYERVARKMAARFRNVASIRFGYLPLTGAHAVKGGLASHYIAKGGSRRRRRQRVGSAVSAPAIFIRAAVEKAI